MARRGENIFKRKDGRWEARYIKERNSNGKAIYGYVYAASYAEVKQKREQCILDQIKSVSFSINATTFEQSAAEWLMNKNYMIKESTAAMYAMIIEKHLTPYFYSFDLNKLDTHVLENFIRLKTSQGYKPKTIQNILVVLKEITAYVTGNSVQKFVYPKNPAKKIRVLSKTETERIMTWAEQKVDYRKAGILMCLYTGLRIGEICALQWDDICLTENMIRIKKTIQRIKNLDSEMVSKTRIIIDTPKTHNAVRDIPIPSKLKSILSAYFPMLPEAYFLTGKKYDFLEPRCYQHNFKKYMAELGIENVTFHTLRHTFATRCIEAGCDVKSLSEILGHANIKITLDRYVHPSFESKRQQMERLDY